MKDGAILEAVACKLDAFPSFSARRATGDKWTTYRRHILKAPGTDTTVLLSV